MKNEFKEFYGSSEYKDDIDENTLIIFDTNSLLNIYRYSKDVEEQFKQTINKNINNIFIPYQVALEFSLNKRNIALKTINMKKNIENNISKEINNTLSKIETNINNLNENIKLHLDNYNVIKSLDETEIRKQVKNDLNVCCDKINKEIKTIISQQLKETWINDSLQTEFDLIPNISLKDNNGDWLANQLTGKIGKAYSQKDIDRIEKEGEIRYQNKIPPGYKDSKSKENIIVYFGNLCYQKKYGDLILWNQILDYLKSTDNKYSKVLFITDDTKADWYYIEKGAQIGKQSIGVSYELRKEMLDETGHFLRIEQTNDFMKRVLKLEEDIVSIDNNFEYDIKNTNLKGYDYLLNKLQNDKKLQNNIEKIMSAFNGYKVPMQNTSYHLENEPTYFLDNEIEEYQFIYDVAFVELYNNDDNFKNIYDTDFIFRSRYEQDSAFRQMCNNNERFRDLYNNNENFRDLYNNNENFRDLYDNDEKFRDLYDNDERFRGLYN